MPRSLATITATPSRPSVRSSGCVVGVVDGGRAGDDARVPVVGRHEHDHQDDACRDADTGPHQASIGRRRDSTSGAPVGRSGAEGAADRRRGRAHEFVGQGRQCSSRILLSCSRARASCLRTVPSLTSSRSRRSACGREVDPVREVDDGALLRRRAREGMVGIDRRFGDDDSSRGAAECRLSASAACSRCDAREAARWNTDR